jgi:hypothetical protein
MNASLKLCVVFVAAFVFIGCPRPVPVPPVVDDADAFPDASPLDAPSFDGSTSGDTFCRVLEGAGCREGMSTTCVVAVNTALDKKISQRITDEIAACLASLPSPATPAGVRGCGTDCTP